MGVLVLKLYIFFVIIVISIYTIRHFLFTFNRALGEQRLGYHDIIDSELPFLSILVPMHNEEKVAEAILSLLVTSDYPKERLEIIPINDHSTDNTEKIIESFKNNYPEIIRPLHRKEENLLRGKAASLNDALKIAKGEIVVVFDADYIPPKGLLKALATPFLDSEVAAVMGRVIPVNVATNLLTRLFDLERIGGYQVDQQARYNLKLIPQYGGTVGGFRKDLILRLGGFDPKILAEDTELTIKIYINGYKLCYENRAECYEEAPETWLVRAKQIRRWSRGHNQVMFKYLSPLIRSHYLSLREKIDGVLLLCVYLVPFIFLLGLTASVVLFFLGDMGILKWNFLIFLLAYNSFGNFAPFFEIGFGALLDGVGYRVFLLPFFVFVFFFNMWYTSLGFIDALKDLILGRHPTWEKTERFRNGNGVDIL